jgi:phage repressor protein C with HTH and peptisase S24 domain
MVMLKDRLISARKAAHKTQKEVADAVKVTQSNYSQLETGRAQSSAYLPAIAKFLGVSAYWLQTGNNDESQSNFIPVEEWDSETPVEIDEVAIPYYKDFLLACGSGMIGEAMKDEWRRLRMSKQTLKNKGVETANAVAMTAIGDSMRPTINDKATVFVDIGRNRIKDGKVFAIDHGGLFKFKRLYALPMGGVRIVSDNAEEYPEERLTAQEVIDQEFKIIGWAFSWQTMDNW